MKRVVSISLGSSARDKKVEAEFLGERFLIERVGTDGSIDKAKQLLAELDGEVACFGMGGIDFYVRSGTKKWWLKDALRIASVPKKTPIVDGGGVKDTLERKVILDLEPVYGIPVRGRNVLVVSGVARYSHAEAFLEAGAKIMLGDLMFVLELPFKVWTLRGLSILAHLIAPLATQMPISMLYPTGESQHKPKPKFRDAYDWAHIIAGDYHFIHRFIPERLDGKVILTNTTTDSDLRELKEKGVAYVVTTTPEMDGRSFATNVIEALLVAISGKGPNELTPADYYDLIERANIKPTVTRLN
ncbi:MAG: quinate 5-dehydrogenase [Bacillota bacterium]|nr:MAG: quinate 5-dehydrogenase [Bacillota bacterium]